MMKKSRMTAAPDKPMVRSLILLFWYITNRVTRMMKNSIPFSMMAKALMNVAAKMVASFHFGIFGYCHRPLTRSTWFMMYE